MLLMHTDQDTNHDENRGFNLNILADKYGVSEKCAFTYANTTADKLWRNKFDEKALNTIYNLADVFLMGGAEGFDIPSLECQAAGIPLIIGNQTSSIELNPNENFGRVRMDGYIEGSLGVEFGCPSVDDIAAVLEAYYNMSKEERQGLKDKAVEFSKKYSWETVCKKWSELLNE
jgi:glycosyltransferase involved in cell wall biosynthesis